MNESVEHKIQSSLEEENDYLRSFHANFGIEARNFLIRKEGEMGQPDLGRKKDLDGSLDTYIEMENLILSTLSFGRLHHRIEFDGFTRSIDRSID